MVQVIGRMRDESRGMNPRLRAAMRDLGCREWLQGEVAALIISEGTQPSDDGRGYLFTPGIYTDDQVIGWRRPARTSVAL